MTVTEEILAAVEDELGAVSEQLRRRITRICSRSPADDPGAHGSKGAPLYLGKLCRSGHQAANIPRPASWRYSSGGCVVCQSDYLKRQFDKGIL